MLNLICYTRDESRLDLIAFHKLIGECNERGLSDDDDDDDDMSLFVLGDQ